jgi:hypothetical protein
MIEELKRGTSCHQAQATYRLKPVSKTTLFEILLGSATFSQTGIDLLSVLEVQISALLTAVLPNFK